MLATSGLLASMAQAQLSEFNSIAAAFRAAMAKGDNAALLANVRKLALLSPGHPTLHIVLARALALNGDGEGAVAQLTRIADFGISFGISGDAAFQGLKNDPGFVAAAQRIANNGKGSGRVKAIVKLGLTGGSEGVAWSETSKSFLIGSNGSIYAYKLDGHGPARPIAKALAPQILGIRPDPASRSYLVCVTDPDGSVSAVVRHREVDGAVMGYYKLPTQNALCNDIALLGNGSFAVTDSNNEAVFHSIGGKLERLALTTPIYQPNGIASDLEKKRLYVAHGGGVIVHDLATGKSRELAADKTLIGALDGMVWHKGSLIGVQSLRDGDARLLRITPDADARAAKVDVVLAGADFPGSASTVAVVGEEAFVIGRTREANGERVEPFLIRVPLQ
jgi:hypothetical protein